jgi:3-mercaptopyruvate sulfurtransferase SseA
MTDVSTAELAGRLEEPGLVLIDVRGAAEYSGDVGAPCDTRWGHVPGARNIDLRHLFGLDAEALRSLVRADEGAEVIAYCHSGQRSAAAVEILCAVGYRARNYLGSWHEWSNDPSLPVVTASTPHAPDRGATDT